jgi:uncharacterized protein YaaQ
VKLIIAVVRDVDVENVLAQLIERKYGVTRLASTGGFLRRGSTTLLIGTDEGRVDEAMETVRSACSPPDSPDQRRVTAFVLPVARFEQL